MTTDLQGAVQVKRHLTALARYRLSQPVNFLMAGGLLSPGRTFFDYGCGRGDDVRALRAAGIDASGWDPFHAPLEPKRTADLVNLGFVLNVIEDDQERVAVLGEAWDLAERVLAVSILVGRQANPDRQTGFRDGYMTSRGTFQKYFETAELRSLLTSRFGSDPVAIAPGIFFSFKDLEEQETFLFRRHVMRRTPVGPAGGARRPVRMTLDLLDAGVDAAVEEIRNFAEERGRKPAHNELSPPNLEQLARHGVSIERAFRFCVSQGMTHEILDAAARTTREGLCLHYALSFLNGARTAKSPSLTMRRDIRIHFGSQRALLDEARCRLHRLADRDELERAIQQALGSRVGVLDHRNRLVLHAARAHLLPGILRLYLGSGSYFLGEAPPTGLIRLDYVRKRISFFEVADWKTEFPAVNAVSSVDLRVQQTRYGTCDKRILSKSVFMTRSGRLQRKLEQERRLQLGLHERVLFENR
ncbi:MAG TPA: DNA phosphorothioation-associated putative methyltransferase [Sphingobium sp.]|uniref:DNA phosphorothioation-associated putative methyltransferase n=1 Tax=Sphingobium sp. TaxID=1912891 RepID=UPI002ED2028D